MTPLRTYAMVLAAYITGCYLAGVILFFGLFTLVTGAEVVPDPTAGPFVGPLMVGLATLIVFFTLLLRGRRVDGKWHPHYIVIPIGLAIAVYIFFAVVGPGICGVVTANIRYFDLAATMLWSPFSVIAALLAALIALVFSLLVTRRAHGGTRPLWPWEKR